MGVLTVVLRVVLGLAFIGAGTSKLVGTQQMVDDFDRFGYPQWFMYFTGAIEVVAALGVLAGIFVPLLAVLWWPADSRRDGWRRFHARSDERSRFEDSAASDPVGADHSRRISSIGSQV